MAKEPKTVATVRLSPQLLERVDQVAGDRGESRSDVLERIITNGIDSEEQFITAMENPVTRTIIDQFARSPRLVSMIAKMVGEQMGEAEIERMGKESKRQAERGRERSKMKTRSKKGAATDGA